MKIPADPRSFFTDGMLHRFLSSSVLRKTRLACQRTESPRRKDRGDEAYRLKHQRHAIAETSLHCAYRGDDADPD
ncbi:hypothetical protein KACC15558_26060 [Brevibacterium ammoniilyticum]|uniref:Uncharacterized protein n=1 Tax=Brevibacterium ammoniilyticum TaxID=1046555 RepID=A0ABP9U1R1_9MICO